MTTMTTPKKLTTVECIRGKSPNEWLAEPDHVYVGRFVYRKYGKFAGERWPNCGFGNPYQFIPGATRQEKIQTLFRFCVHLQEKLIDSPLLQREFGKLSGKTLGCWCINWEGQIGDIPPMCHAAWMARIINLFLTTQCELVRVYEIDGAIIPDGKPIGKFTTFNRRTCGVTNVQKAEA